VFSHLRWDFFFQRLQQLLSRMAARYPIVFVEEPVYDEEKTFLKTCSPAPGILVCQPHTPISQDGFHDDHLPYLQKLMRQLVRDYPDHIAWFTTPMALPLLQELQPRRVVYDCMDELAAFRNAPKQLPQRENALLKAADLVFTSCRGLYRIKSERHPSVYCIPGSVDAAHFLPSLDRVNSHPAHKDIPGPRLGFYGVLDERLDMDLVAKVADAHAQWQIVMVGPVVNIDPAELPQRDNIHYLGEHSYEALPQFLAGWDVCLLPFARNEAARFSSPAETLEYVAAELPIVSTPVPDVMEAYGDIVAIAQDAPAFIAACEAALLASPEEHEQRIEKMRKVIAGTSWEATVEKVCMLIENTPRRTDGSLAIGGTADEKAETAALINRLRQHETPRFVTTAIIGAGPTGLSAAYHLGHDAVLLERNSMVGGWCRSIKDNGFTFDHAGHIMFSGDPYVLELYELLLGSNLHWQNREAWVYSKNVYTRYPFQGALHGLPPDVIKECILGAIEARYGSAACGGKTAPAATRAGDCCADGAVLPGTNVAALEKRGPANFEEFIHQAWGAGIAKHFAIPYNRKLWAVPLAEMETSWLDGRVPLPDLEEIIDGALKPSASPMGPNARFGYPLRGGFQALVSAFVPHIKGTIELNADVAQLSPRQRIITLRDGRRYQYDTLISTMPLPELVKSIGDEAPEEVRQAANGLKHISVRCVNLGVAREHITDKHWIYYPEDSVIFHRIFAQGNASPDCNPPGGFGITCEISYSPAWKPLPASGQALIERCIRDCIKVGILREDDRIIAANEIDMPYAYVVYDHARARNVEAIKSWLAMHGVILAGRYGEWEYYNSDHAFIAGKKAAEAVKWMEKKRAVAAE
jgi:protoporphyrinogen oxidase/glycosyltransferase involved in cell wall biosynthesis